MAFTWLNKQGVKSDEGYALQSTGRFDWEYTEGATVIRLTGQGIHSAGRWGFAFAPGWAPGLSAERREAVRHNISEAMNFMDLQAEFDS